MKTRASDWVFGEEKREKIEGERDGANKRKRGINGTWPKIPRTSNLKKRKIPS